MPAAQAEASTATSASDSLEQVKRAWNILKFVFSSLVVQCALVYPDRLMPWYNSILTTSPTYYRVCTTSGRFMQSSTKLSLTPSRRLCTQATVERPEPVAPEEPSRSSSQVNNGRMCKPG